MVRRAFKPGRMPIMLAKAIRSDRSSLHTTSPAIASLSTTTKHLRIGLAYRQGAVASPCSPAVFMPGKEPAELRAREDARQTEPIRQAWNDSGKVYG